MVRCLVGLGTGCLLACSAGEGVALRARPLDAGLPGAGDAQCVVVEQSEPPPAEPSVMPDPIAHRYFGIRVREADSGVPIAGAELETVHHIVYRSDRNGRIAFYEPGLMDSDVFFTPRAEGYTFPKDGFGYSGRALRTVEGGEGIVELTRDGTPPARDEDDRETQRLASPVPRDCFAVRVVDQESKRGVPLVFLQGPRDRYVTDSQGMSAICELGAPITLAVSSHGYSYAPRQLTLTPVAGGSARIELTRDNLAERLYRSTGGGIYRDSTLLGLSAPLPALRGGVLSQDSGSVVDLGDKLFWSWGITDRASYPLGNFSACGALGSRSLTDFTYFTNDQGFCRSLTPALPPENLATWLTSTFAATQGGSTRAYAAYIKPDGNLTPQGRGLLRLDGEQMVDLGVRYPLANFTPPEGQALRFGDMLYFMAGMRVPANEDALRDLSRYQTQEVVSDLRDARTGTAITVNGGSGWAYNSRRQRFVRIFVQRGGSTSFLGEVWYVEGDTPVGPWVYAQKILSHDGYTFYGPFIHDVLPLRAHGRYITFEGTYTDALAGDSVVRTPRYNRNQLVYQLDLDRLALPVPIYPGLLAKAELPRDSADVAPLFHAPDRPAPGTVPFAWTGPSCAPRALVQGTPTPPVFYAHAADDDARPSYLVPLTSLEGGGYGIGGGVAPLAYVWPATTSRALPVASFLAPLRADAGPDQCITQDQELLLDASRSVMPSGVVRMTWWRHGDACTRSEGPTLRVRLPPGVHSYVLELEDAQGNQSRDSVIVEVR
ncbi:MAG: hypothetical protein ABW352_12330 [Polyangiales bacterium]